MTRVDWDSASTDSRCISTERMALVMLLAGDVPFTHLAIPRLLATLAEHGVALLVDAEDNDQDLIAARQGKALRTRVLQQEASGTSMRQLLGGANAIRIVAQGPESRDCDESKDVVLARRIATSTSWVKPRPPGQAPNQRPTL